MAAWLALSGLGAAAQDLVTEVLSLDHRSAEEIVPVVRPLVAEPGSVSGLYTTLVVKATREDMAAVLEALEALDRPPRNLVVTVRHGDADRYRQDAAGISDTASTYGSGPGVRVYDSRATTEGSQTQSVRVLEGHEAFIRFGESVPLALRSLIVFGADLALADGIEHHDLSTGFYVRPRLGADRVTLEISPHRRNLADYGGGAIEVREASTTVSGRLGEWIPLAGSSNQAETGARVNVYATRSNELRAQSMLLRVDLIGE